MAVSPKVCILRAPGTNCDVETAHAFEMCGATAERVHVFRLLESPELLKEYQIFCVPGGFSYGDDIGAGVIFSRQLRGRLGEAMHEFLSEDKLALGICNGFQVLLKAGLLPSGIENWPPPENSSPAVTLTWNDNGKYTARWVKCKVPANTQNVFLRGIEEIDLPIAHAEGKIVAADPAAISRWQEQGLISLQYVDPTAGDSSANETSLEPIAYPHNPNGSQGNIAGLGDSTGRILGLMPHPERFIHATQHPQWTRCKLVEMQGQGLKMFQNAVDYFE